MLRNQQPTRRLVCVREASLSLLGPTPPRGQVPYLASGPTSGACLWHNKSLSHPGPLEGALLSLTVAPPAGAGPALWERCRTPPGAARDPFCASATPGPPAPSPSLPADSRHLA